MDVKSIRLNTPEGQRNMSYTDWGKDTLAPPVLCVHGLTRNSRDFDYLAKVLAQHRRVICLDMIGRGDSDWFDDKNLYSHTEYTAICVNFLNALEIDIVEWIGTSMGGLIGMMLAALPASASRIEKLIMNDVGCFIPKAPLQRLSSYVGKDPKFDSMEDALAYLKEIAQPFGPLSNEQWQHLAQHTYSQRDNGKLGFRYDLGIALAFDQAIEDADLSEFWQMVEQPTLLIRGKESDLLLEKTAQQMAQKENCQLVEFAGIGHAPTLMSEDQIETIVNFLD